MAAAAAISSPATTNLQQRRRHHLPPSSRSSVAPPHHGPPFAQLPSSPQQRTPLAHLRQPPLAPPRSSSHLHRSCSSAATVHEPFCASHHAGKHCWSERPPRVLLPHAAAIAGHQRISIAASHTCSVPATPATTNLLQRRATSVAPSLQQPRQPPRLRRLRRRSRAVSRHCHLHLHCICRNPNSGERKCTATCQHLIGQSNWSNWSTGQSQQSTLVKTAKMVK
ncbi:hypothetical protein DEO72_LG1g2288 [Vigna unguiculata]|uniref:Uncharacterized protein n=1 Tax=Vigna unguiculata TaxID=3917 RepID=A0A4D6KMA6_VIGUN|nr:hypothetical protein DEO72_LG1g2288 [Vigna unguiculata]